MNTPIKPPRVKDEGPEIEIREAELEDLSQVFALGERLFTADLWPTLYRTWDEYEVVELFATDGDTCLVAEMEGKVVGFALGTLIEKRRSSWTYGYLLWLGVDPDVGRRGVGARLVRRITDVFIQNGARMLLVDTDADNERAIEFFKAQGFGNLSEHVYLTKNLTRDPGYAKQRRRGGSQSNGHPRKSRQPTPDPRGFPPEDEGRDE